MPRCHRLYRKATLGGQRHTEESRECWPDVAWRLDVSGEGTCSPQVSCRAGERPLRPLRLERQLGVHRESEQGGMGMWMFECGVGELLRLERTPLSELAGSSEEDEVPGTPGGSGWPCAAGAPASWLSSRVCHSC